MAALNPPSFPSPSFSPFPSPFASTTTLPLTNNNGTNATALFERAEVHKSCKSMEVLLGLFNEYCEAAGAVVGMQKKLGKALRDVAGLKVTGEVAAKAMNASATIFEALAEVDSKFAKVADKEYDAVSAEVKKWFKKLTKEERNHDERMASANAKIKQAGQNYEKRSKKKAIDASDEHARYINLINTLGPEISQDKYTHALTVTQRHSSTTNTVAASLSRLADSEWHRSCESVRRFSPTIGPLGRWRALCEGDWVGGVPGDLVGVDGYGVNETENKKDNGNEDAVGDGTTTAVTPSHSSSSSGGGGGLKPIREETNASAATIRAATITNTGMGVRAEPDPQPSGNTQSHSSTNALEPPRNTAPAPPGYSTGPPSASTSTHDLLREHASLSARGSTQTQTHTQTQTPTQSQNTTSTANTNTSVPPSSFNSTANSASSNPLHVDPNTGSVRSLSAFPSPPTHFPIPPLPLRSSTRQLSSLSLSLSASGSGSATGGSYTPGATHLELPTNSLGAGPMAESPVSTHSDLEDSFRTAEQNFRDSGGSNMNLNQSRAYGTRRASQEDLEHISSSSPSAETNVERGIRRPIPVKAQTSLPARAHQQQQQSNALAQTRTHRSSSSADLVLAAGGVGSGRYRDREGAFEDTQGGNERAERTGEFGMLDSYAVRQIGGAGLGGKAKTMESASGAKVPRAMERSDTVGSTGSLVAAMRNRYSNSNTSGGSTSPPPPRELPRMPAYSMTSVNDLAARYQPGDNNNNANDVPPLSPRIQNQTQTRRASSPPVTRQQSLPMLDLNITARTREAYEINSSAGGFPVKSRGGDEERRYRQQQQQREEETERAEHERKTKEQELEQLERELEARSRELEWERARLRGIRDDEQQQQQQSSSPPGQNAPFALRPRERRTSLRQQYQRPVSQMDQDGTTSTTSSNAPAQSNHRRGSGQQQLVPPSAPTSPVKPGHGLASPNRQYSQNPLPSPSSPRMEAAASHDNRNTHEDLSRSANHASNCGCEACSVSKYASPSGRQSVEYGSRVNVQLQYQQQLQQQQQQQQHQRVDSKPDKPKSWMRRLSMPVGNALGLDSSKRNQQSTNTITGSVTNFSLGSGVGNTPVGGGGRSIFSMDGKKNASTTALGSRFSSSSGVSGVDAREDEVRGGGGRQVRGDGRGYQVGGGISNRSMTNLGVMGRH